MQTNDIIRVNVTGTNGNTRKQSTISRVFNGLGERLNDKGQVDDSSKEVLRNLPGGGGSEMPQFDNDAFQAAITAADPAKVKQIQLEYAEKVTKWESQSGGGSENLQIARAVLAYAKEFHGFREEDGDHFVMKLENLDVQKIGLPDNRSMFTVAGTAVFGA